MTGLVLKQIASLRIWPLKTSRKVRALWQSSNRMKLLGNGEKRNTAAQAIERVQKSDREEARAQANTCPFLSEVLEQGRLSDVRQ